MESDKKPAAFDKYKVARADAKDSPGCRHHGCEYFVLDITHDPFAVPALKAYAEACENDEPELANNIRAKLAQMGV